MAVRAKKVKLNHHKLPAGEAVAQTMMKYATKKTSDNDFESVLLSLPRMKFIQSPPQTRGRTCLDRGSETVYGRGGACPRPARLPNPTCDLKLSRGMYGIGGTRPARSPANP